MIIMYSLIGVVEFRPFEGHSEALRASMLEGKKEALLQQYPFLVLENLNENGEVIPDSFTVVGGRHRLYWINHDKEIAKLWQTVRARILHRKDYTAADLFDLGNVDNLTHQIERQTETTPIGLFISIGIFLQMVFGHLKLIRYNFTELFDTSAPTIDESTDANAESKKIRRENWLRFSTNFPSIVRETLEKMLTALNIMPDLVPWTYIHTLEGCFSRKFGKTKSFPQLFIFGNIGNVYWKDLIGYTSCGVSFLLSDVNTRWHELVAENSPDKKISILVTDLMRLLRHDHPQLSILKAFPSNKVLQMIYNW